MLRSLAVAALCSALAASAQASTVVINEFRPNPAGIDPGTTQVELRGTPGEAFLGVLTFVETDDVNTFGFVQNSEAVSGTFDSNGLLTATIADFENPSFVMVLGTSNFAINVDLDPDGDGAFSSPAVFGTYYDAIGIIDVLADANGLAASIGGVEFDRANEFELVFRDSVTLDWYGVDEGAGQVYDIDGTLAAVDGFDGDPLTASFGAVNPTLAATPPVIPLPATAWMMLAGLGALAVARRRRGAA